MKKLVVIFGLLSCYGVAHAAMVSSDSIGNDPAKAKLCAQRAHGTAVPFEIDSSYVASSRDSHPDTTFVAIDGGSPQLIECYLRDGTGKYEPASMSPEQGFWHLLKPKQFEPGIGTQQGREMAAKVCLDAGTAKINRPAFDHSVDSSVVEITLGSRAYHPGASIAGAKAARYDIAVEGTSFYKSSGPDLAAVNITCLLSPQLDVKGIHLK
ncbi:hypothetical protein [Sodalis sp. dw_96]|uniref:hypothetical protein n=1 Tax=Sodalis sp. dw_96 TaxID=2719794 RepID=UPI001BD6C8F4|nr:hypothetical protein [Sodalis sp. dw_96]